MKLHRKIIKFLTADIPTILGIIGYKGIPSAKKLLIKMAEKTATPSREVRKIHNAYMIIMFASMFASIMLLSLRITIIGSFMAGIFLGLFTLMIISWFIFVDCPLTKLEEEIRKRGY